MKKIVEVEHIAYIDRSDCFSSSVKDTAKKLQDKGLEVEIQYSSCKVGSYGVNYNALLIGYEKEEI